MERRRLPPLNALRAFEAAARHLNFSRAADELSVLKVEEGDTTSSVATFTGCVSGTDYTIATNAYTSTTNQNVWSFGIDCRARKRYLKVSASPQTTMVIGASAVLMRGESAPATSAQAGALNAVYV